MVRGLIHSYSSQLLSRPNQIAAFAIIDFILPTDWDWSGHFRVYSRFQLRLNMARSVKALVALCAAL